MRWLLYTWVLWYPRFMAVQNTHQNKRHILEFIATGEAAGYASASEAAASERKTLKTSNAVLLQAIQELPRPQRHFTHAEDIALARAVLAGGIAMSYVHDD